MRLTLLWAGTISLVGCALPVSQPSLINSWVLYGDTYLQGLTLLDNGSYQSTIAVPVDGDVSNWDVQLEEGTYLIGDGTLTFKPLKWTCSAADTSYQVFYTWSDNNTLEISTATTLGKAHFTVAPAPVQVQQTLGCFTTEGFFPNPLMSLYKTYKPSKLISDTQD